MVTRSYLVLAGMCFFTLLGTSCTMFEKKTTKEAGLVVVNVLDKNLYDDCHIDPQLIAPGKKVSSVNVSMDDLEKHAETHWDKALTHIIVYCANYMCTASAESAKILKDLGYQHVWAYEGGTAEWKNLGYPVAGACTKGYLKQFEKPEGHEVPADVPAITAQELKQKIETFES